MNGTPGTLEHYIDWLNQKDPKMKIDTNKTIEHNGKTYRCRDASISPVIVYKNSSGSMKPYMLVFSDEYGIYDSVHLYSTMKQMAGKTESAYDLIEIKSQKQQLIDLLERGINVPFSVKDYRANTWTLTFGKCFKNETLIDINGELWSDYRPLTQSELDSMSFEKLINKERE
jgi:hypothetical protein